MAVWIRRPTCNSPTRGRDRSSTWSIRIKSVSPASRLTWGAAGPADGEARRALARGEHRRPRLLTGDDRQDGPRTRAPG